MATPMYKPLSCASVSVESPLAATTGAFEVGLAVGAVGLLVDGRADGLATEGALVVGNADGFRVGVNDGYRDGDNDGNLLVGEKVGCESALSHEYVPTPVLAIQKSCREFPAPLIPQNDHVLVASYCTPEDRALVPTSSV